MTTLTTPDSLDAVPGDGAPGEPVAAPASTEHGPISPELVLVDPELARLVHAIGSTDANDFPLRGADRAHRSLLELDVRSDAALPPDRYERWGDELRLFLEPAPADEAFGRRRDDALAGSDMPHRRTPATGPQPVVPARRRLGTRIVRPVGILVAGILLGGAGAALGGLVSASSPEGASREAGTHARTGSATSPPQSTPTIVPTKSTDTSRERAGGPRIMAWAPAPRAAAYEVALYDGSRRIFRKRTKHTRLALPVEWSYGGRRRRLEQGVYRWYVWPVPAGARRPSARPVVQASLTIPSA